MTTTIPWYNRLLVRAFVLALTPFAVIAAVRRPLEVSHLCEDWWDAMRDGQIR